MKLSTRCRYGTRALIEIARHSQNGPVSRRDIRRTQGITESYMENILSVLKSQDLVRTIRGAGGGFVLARPAANIRLLDIVTALEGSIAPVDCVEKPELCEKSGTCGARAAWVQLYQAEEAVLSSITLKSLLETEDEAIPLNFVI